jgi:hypothetical protein
MDLEHTNLGKLKHCQFIGCNQRDFLPFNCKFCSKLLCSEHHNPNKHNCTNIDVLDITSVECPICSKTVKFNKLQDSNEAWDMHYVNDCSKTQEVVKQVKKCVTCYVKLGVSNTFTCPKCKKQTCLSHRDTFEHECICNNRNKASSSTTSVCSNSRLLKNDSNTKSNPVVKNSQTTKSQQNIKSKNSSDFSFENSVKGTAVRRGQQVERKDIPKTEQMTPQVENCLLCPFCSYNDSRNEDELMKHISTNHPEPTSSASSSSFGFNPKQTSTNRERCEECPVCHAKFSDTIELIDHCERFHNQDTSKSNNSKKSESSCKIT